LVADLLVERGAASLGRQSHLPSYRLVEVHGIAGGEWHVEDLVEAGMETFHRGSRGGALAAAAIAGEDSNAAHIDEMGEARLILLRARRGEELVARNVLAEGAMREAEVLHIHHAPSLLPRAKSRMRSAEPGGVCVEDDVSPCWRFAK